MPIAQAGVEYRTRKGTYSFMAANVDLVNERGVYVAQVSSVVDSNWTQCLSLQYLHRLMPRLDVGIELTHQQGVQVPGAPSTMSVLSYGARYNGKTYACFAFSEVCYFQATGAHSLAQYRAACCICATITSKARVYRFRWLGIRSP